MTKAKDNTNTTSKPKGRPKGSESGPRQISYIASNYDLKVTEKIGSPPNASKEEVEAFSIDMATDIFIEMHGEKPDSIEGPVYFKNVAKNASKKQDDAITISVNSLTEIGELLGEVTFDNWKGTAFSVVKDNVESDTEIFFIAKQDLLNDSGRIKPQIKKINKNMAIMS